MAKYPHWSKDVVRDEALKFKNHFIAATGKAATKNDWYATWQNWCMSEIAQRAHPVQSDGKQLNRQEALEAKNRAVVDQMMLGEGGSHGGQ